MNLTESKMRSSNQKMKSKEEKLIRLEEITRENIDEVLALKVDESQKSFVSTNGDSLAQAYYTLWKFMIDRRYQNKGYGRQALELGIQFLQNRFNASEIYTGVVPGNTVAKKLYESVGFADTGLVELGMEEMRLTL